MNNPFIEIAASKRSLRMRGLVYGVGTNDAPYQVAMKTESKTILCPYYKVWRSMLDRCYSPAFHAKNPTYVDCTVDESWLVFTVFRSWMEKQDSNNMHLDKDLIKPGNLVYSPSTCCFVSAALNTLLNDHGAAKGEYPRGISWHKMNKNYRVRCCLNDKRWGLGSYDTVQEASTVYRKFKFKVVRAAAEQQSDIRIKMGLYLHAELIMGYDEDKIMRYKNWK